MMISPAGASPYAAAAALDRQWRSADDGAGDAAPSTAPVPGPDVVVTLSRGTPAPAAYDASGKFAGAPAPDDAAAGGADSSAPAATSSADDGDAPAPAAADAANVGEDSAVAA
jgi:hypothetical protein